MLTDMNKITNKLLISIIILLSMFINVSASDNYSFRKYLHVKSFYSDIALDCIKVGLKYNIPPAAVMAIAGLESGYGSGYVAQITGNILSLGAFKGDKELPRVYLPYSKSKKSVLFDSQEIKKMPESDLVWKKRPKSYKRDYRPTPYAGTTTNLELLKYNSIIKKQANKVCLNDFATRWIIESSKVKVFSEARVWLDSQVLKHGKDILFDKKINRSFIDKIGGHPHSFNYRKTWPKKAKLIMKKAGLVELSNDMYINKLTFEKAWSNK